MSSELPAELFRVLRTLYEWRFERGRNKCLKRVPDYFIEASLHGSGIDALVALDRLSTMELVRPVGRGDEGGTWELPGGRALRSTLVVHGRGAEQAFEAKVEVSDGGGPWRRVVCRIGSELCGVLYDLTPAGERAARAPAADSLDGIPPLDNSGRWLTCGQAAKHQNIGTDSLRTARGRGRKTADGLAGIDGVGRAWRKQSDNSPTRYLAESLPDPKA